MQASWELDFWGKFRRSVESADAQLAASVANYDDVLVSLTADLATRLHPAAHLPGAAPRSPRTMSRCSEEGLQIATGAFRAASTDERDVQQAKTILASTQATIPQLEQQIEQTRNSIATLIGLPPSPLSTCSTSPRASRCRRRRSASASRPTCCGAARTSGWPRRRPRPQSALIGVQKADLYPAFSLTGTFGFAASDWGPFQLGDITQGRSRTFGFGPSVVWDFLNYGRIENAVRAQDAAFQQAYTNYQETVLQAQSEVENGLIGFRKQQEKAKFLSEAVRAAQRSLDLAFAQYSGGITDFTTVLVAEQQLLQQQDQLAVTAGRHSRATW